MQLINFAFHGSYYIVHRILQARILEWVAFPFSSGCSQPRDPTQVSPIAGRYFTSWVTMALYLKHHCKPSLYRLSPILASKSFIVLYCTFKSIIHLELLLWKLIIYFYYKLFLFFCYNIIYKRTGSITYFKLYLCYQDLCLGAIMFFNEWMREMIAGIWGISALNCLFLIIQFL